MGGTVVCAGVEAFGAGAPVVMAAATSALAVIVLSLVDGVALWAAAGGGGAMAGFAVAMEAATSALAVIVLSLVDGASTSAAGSGAGGTAGFGDVMAGLGGAGASFCTGMPSLELYSYWSA